MRRAAILLLLLTASASAQIAINPEQAPRVLREFESHPGDTPLRCEVTPLAPILNFAFRFQAGYTYHVPQTQYPGPVQGWSEFTTITPDGGGKPTYLLSRHQLADASRSDLTFDVNGLYLLGVGTYSVESAIHDDRNRVCRKHWHIVVKPARTDRLAQSALPAFAVRPISAASYFDTQHTGAGRPLRLSILINAAAFSPKRTGLRPTDRLVLLEALTAMLEHLPAASTRLVVFSLEQQREIFRSDNFSLRAMSKVADAISALRLATVDVHLLQKPLGHVDFLAGLVNQELQAPVPADAVVFLGPPSRYDDKIPALLLHRPSSRYPHFFYLQYQGPRRLTLPPNPEDEPAPRMGGKGGGPPSPADGGSAYPDPSQPQPSRQPPPPNNGNTNSGSTNGASGSTNSGTNSNGGSGTTSGRAGGGGMGGGRNGRGLPPTPEPMEHNTDIIHAAVARLKGRTLVLHTPSELAGAIRRIEMLQ